MTKEELKQFVCDYLDAHEKQLVESGETLLRMPELSYREERTSAFVEQFFSRLGLSQKNSLAITGRRADVDTGRPGPCVGVLGELDALIVPNHPFANPSTHAAHACGHYAGLNAMLGCAEALTQPEVLSHLSGRIAFVATPSEECQNQPYIASLIEEGKLRFFGGKSEMIAEGVFDDIDIAMMAHAGSTIFTPSGFNGFVMKRLVFRGKAAHAGANPEKGINAIAMMRSAMNMIDAQRDTFRDEDHVRIHGYISEGGEAVNVVPDRIVYVLQVRGGSPEAIKDASDKVDRCVEAAAIAFGGETEVHNIFGFMPLIPYESLDNLMIANAAFVAPDTPCTRGIYRPSSTDMGDVSMIRPSLHLYFDGFTGTAHTDSFLAKDLHAAYVNSAKYLALNTIDLLYDNASCGVRIAAEKCPMTKDEYIKAMERFSSTRKFGLAVK